MNLNGQRDRCHGCGYPSVIPNIRYGLDYTHGITWQDPRTDGAIKSINILEICKGGKWEEGVIFTLKDMESQGFDLNIYDPCVVNKMVNGKHITNVQQVDDLKILQVEEKEVTQIIKCMKIMCEEDIMMDQGNNHDYLGIDLNLSIPW